MRWAGNYNSETIYTGGDVVRDDVWTMVAKVPQTQEYPYPQPTGSRFWISGLDVEDFTQDSILGPQLICGQRYYHTSNFQGWITGVRFGHFGDSFAFYDLWIVNDPTGPNPTIAQIASSVTPGAGPQWVTVPVAPSIIAEGATFDVVLLTRNTGGTPSSFQANYDYKQSSGTPGQGEIYHQGNAIEMRIHHDDDDDIDRQAQLEALTPGDKITAGSQTWEIIGVDQRGSHVRFDVTPATRIAENKYLFTFEESPTATIEYGNVPNHYSGFASVDGFFSTTGYENIVIDQDAYNVDLEIQQADVSADWALVAYSGS